MNHKILNKTVIPRTIVAALFYFILYGFLGWGIDTVYNSLLNSVWQPAGFFKSLLIPVPFAPIYGFGAWTLILLKYFLEERHPVMLFFLAGIYATAVEYWGGVWMVWVFNRRAWDYSDSWLNLNGHINLWHSILWLILGWLFVKKIHPYGRGLFNQLIGKHL